MAEGGRNLTIKLFTVDEDHIATGEKFDEWLDELEREMRFFRISDAGDIKDAMLIYGGVEIRRLEKSLQDPKEGDTYVKLKGKLNNYFSFWTIRLGQTLRKYFSGMRRSSRE